MILRMETLLVQDKLEVDLREGPQVCRSGEGLEERKELNMTCLATCHVFQGNSSAQG